MDSVTITCCEPARQVADVNKVVAAAHLAQDICDFDSCHVYLGERLRSCIT